MHLIKTKVMHEGNMLKVEFFGDKGEVVSVQMNSRAVEMDDMKAIDEAKAIMIQLTAFGTRDGGRSLNTYDAASNGNFDESEPYPADDLSRTKH